MSDFNFKLNNRQEFIIDFAEKQKTFQTKDVLDVVKKRFKVERLTVVRDLSLLKEKSILNSEGKGRAVFYEISPYYLAIREIDVEKYFSKPFSDRDANPVFNNEVFELLNRNLFTSLELKRLKKAEDKYIKTENELREKSPAILKREWERLIIELSWKSSEIEGNTYTLLETEALIKDSHFAKGKEKAEAQMILNHKKALYFILKNADYFKTIDIARINKLHTILTEGLEIKADFRDKPVGITGTIYRPPARKKEIKKEIDKLIVSLDNTDNAFVKAFIALAMIAYIQPFEDGNKRSSRIIANAILHANGKPMLSYRDVDPIEYKKAVLLFYEQNNFSYIKKIFIEQTEFSVKNYFA